MKLEAPAFGVSTGGDRSANVWRKYFLMLCAGLMLLFGVYTDTWLGMVDIWYRSDTYAHGFLIGPITLWLIWQRRKQVTLLQPSPALLPLVGLVLLGAAWLVGNVAGAVVVQQYAFVLMLPLLVWAIVGWQVTKALLFPLCYLVLAVPFGEVLLPWMMNFTADFTVGLLRMTGIPVYREGLFFTIPSGQWSVVEACSGLRYLIASFTLGTLYAYLTYRRFSRRLIFTLASIVVPVLANGLRAYMIVMIGHMSDMKYAVGVDHLIYGWLFFGIIMLGLFWVGAYWREDIDRTDQPQSSTDLISPVPARLFLTIALVLVTVLPWPVYADYLKRRPAGSQQTIVIDAPQGWTQVSRRINWTPAYDNAPYKFQQEFASGAQLGGVFIGFYPGSLRGAEMVSTGNGLFRDEHQEWTLLQQMHTETQTWGQVLQSDIRGSAVQFRLWQRYWVDGRWTANPYYAKLLQAKARLMGEPGQSAIVMLYVLGDSQGDDVMNAFAAAMSPMLEQGLQHAK
ncbi:exosortase A [Chitinivorax sp. B]|uniref:exosortase A n=1 Tax=Chitinivorax sp. B TaxID=2502235 RepID=UPI0010F9C92A|nr:exosortase A [Chitinivorax sp. B]